MNRPMPTIDVDLCNLCGDCVSACPEQAARVSPLGRVELDEQRCSYCGACEDLCPEGAISVPYDVVFADDGAEGG